MLFNSPGFAAFFVAFFIAYHFVCRGQQAKLWLITISSLLFYATWSWKGLPVLLGTGLLDFYIALRLGAITDPARRLRLVSVSVVANLATLAFFKYTNFFLDSGQGLATLLGWKVEVRHLDLFVPLGISFYTFQSLSYTIDVYRGALKPRTQLREFVASLTFFPHLLAGPIVRSAQLLPQFESPRPPKWGEVQQGFLRFSSGLLKKTLADALGATVNGIFGAPQLGGIECWIGAIAFAAQMYGDFAGYSDMAIGMSRLFGFRLPENFNLPFVSASIPEYWRRCHITLSTWLRDYLYTPLALQLRRSPYLTLVITMVIAGLWHGPRWTYVAFGLVHGLGLAVTQWLGDKLPPEWSDTVERPAWRLPLIALNFYIVLIGFVFFRAETFEDAMKILRGMHGLSPVATSLWSIEPLAVTLALLVGCHLLDWAVARVSETPKRPALVWGAISVGLAFGIMFRTPDNVFIYFQF